MPPSKKKTNVPRMMRTKIKTARGRKQSSTRWLERQLNDPYVQRAQSEGYASRSAYKLIEIDDRHRILNRGNRVIDLGAAPGGWCQVAVDRVGSTNENPLVVGIDLLPMSPVSGAVILERDFLDSSSPSLLLDALGGAPPDIILSDMASPTTGHKKTDHLRTMSLVEVALDFALDVLPAGGHFLSKTFAGGTERELLTSLKGNFGSVIHTKPPSSRSGSVELYFLARSRRS